VKFLEAKKVVDAFTGGPLLPFVFALSGSAEAFALYLRAAAAVRGREAAIDTLPFNTLSQRLRTPLEPTTTEVVLLLPWDFAPEIDWRSGFPQNADEQAIRESAELISGRLAKRASRLIYLPAPVPPLFSDPNRNASLATWLQSVALGLGARMLPREAFSLAGYFSSGCPVGGGWIGAVAEIVVDEALAPVPAPKKVLVTDLDNVMWAGIVGEDGVDGIAFEPGGRGYAHFVYQGLLRRLRGEGTLLAAVSRNDAEIALAPFRSGRMILREEDFVALLASYHAKSAQISDLARRLNLSVDSFVFVDDNVVELAEVSLALPTVRCVPFPPQAEGIPPFLDEIAQLFARLEFTKEDQERTILYRRRLEGLVPTDLVGADIRGFLQDLGMTLTLHDRSNGDRTRAVQLINKTNQFNLNGNRVREEQVASVLEAGGRLYGATLSDRTGQHGEILACLVGSDRVITSFVMSCRVFQRRVEYAFMAWLAQQPDAPIGMAWSPTPRNEPFAQFLRELGAGHSSTAGLIPIEPGSVHLRFASELGLFSLEVG